MEDKRINQLIDKALSEEATLPEGLGARLESYIDSLPAGKVRRGKEISLRKRVIYISCSAAAVVLLALLVFRPGGVYDTRGGRADTFDDPREAAVAAEQAIAYMARQMNRGFRQVEIASREIEKTKEILTKYLN